MTPHPAGGDGAAKGAALEPALPRGPVEYKLAELFGLDLRSLALFRIGLALLVLFDLGSRAADLTAFYSDEGVLPRASLLEYFSNQFYLCVHLISGAWWVQAALFALASAAALVLLVGYYTRVALFVSWFMLISLQNRNPMVVQGGDVFLRMLLFWGLFLPLGARFSVDSALNTARRRPRSDSYFLSVATFALVIQIGIVYWFGVLLKCPSLWWRHATDVPHVSLINEIMGRFLGTNAAHGWVDPTHAPRVWIDGGAVRYALNVDIYATRAGIWLRTLPAGVLRVLTWVTLIMEAFGPFVALIPFWTQRFRILGILLMIGMHVSFGLFLDLGLFSYVGSVAWLVLLPPLFWDGLFARLRTPARTGLTIYWDGECEFCRRMVLLIHTFFLLPETRVRRAQEEPAIFAELQRENSWIVVDHTGRHRHAFEALAYVVGLSPWAWPLSYVMRWGPVMRYGTRVYHAVAKDRAKGARYLSVLKPHPTRIRSTALGAAVAAASLAYVLAWNIREFNFASFNRFYPNYFNRIAMVVRVDQYWSMFAPFPLTADGWWVAPGKLRNGREVDVLTGRAVTYDKPPVVCDVYHNQRWRKYLENLCSPNFASQHLYFGRYLCRSWDDSHAGENRMERFSVVFMQEDTRPTDIAPVRRVTYWNHHCFDPPAKPVAAPAPPHHPLALPASRPSPGNTETAPAMPPVPAPLAPPATPPANPAAAFTVAPAAA